MTDQSTAAFAEAIAPVLVAIGERVSGSYGGIMEHLWIDLELIESHANQDGAPKHSFRFQKRVSGRSHFGLPPGADTFNVGHFSVRPSFDAIRALPTEEAIAHALSSIYRGTAVLCAKSKRLGGFDAHAFRAKLREACDEVGYQCEA